MYMISDVHSEDPNGLCVYALLVSGDSAGLKGVRTVRSHKARNLGGGLENVTEN